MRYVFKNIGLLFRNEPFLAAVIVLCVLVSSWTLLFSYGLYQNYNVQIDQAQAAVSSVAPEINEGAVFTASDYVKYAETLDPSVADDVKIFVMNALIDNWVVGNEDVIWDPDEGETDPNVATLTIRAAVRDHRICRSEYFTSLMEKNGQLYSGHIPTDEEEDAGARVCLVQYNDYLGVWDQSCLAHKTGENTIEFLGQEYEVIGEISTGSYCPIVPLKSLPDDLRLSSIALYFGDDAPVTRDQYKLITETAEAMFPNVFTFEDIAFPESDTIYVYNNVIFISVLIAVLVVINFTAVYFFIIRSRRRQIAILNICGASKGRLFLIFLCECCVLGVPVFALGTALFIPFMKNVLSGIFPYMEGAFSPVIYLIAAVIYFAALIIVVSIMLIRVLGQRIADTVKEGAI